MASCVRYDRESWFHSSLRQQEIVNNSETEIPALTTEGDSETVASRLATGQPADVVAVIFLTYFAGIQLQRLGPTNTLVEMAVYRLPYQCYFNQETRMAVTLTITVAETEGKNWTGNARNAEGLPI